MADTGAPLNLPQPAHGAINWDAVLNPALAAINGAIATINTALAAKADLSGGKVPSTQLPSISAIQATPVANQAAMLALSSAVVGTVVLRLDLSSNNLFVLTAVPYSTLGNWSVVQTGIGVTSVNGETGVVTGYAKTATANTWSQQQTFSVSPSVPTASASDAPVPKAQMDTAISGITSSGSAPYVASVGNGSSLGPFTLTHGRGRAAVEVTCWDVSVSPPEIIIPDKVTRTTTTVAVSFLDAPATNGVEVSVF